MVNKVKVLWIFRAIFAFFWQFDHPLFYPKRWWQWVDGVLFVGDRLVTPL
ncbi:MAG: hypothetical protein QNJ33_04585 [Crocosphaera sp.]|nr:hypothetical protein [Crocosphaera sp.]